MKTNFKRLFALLLTLCMLASLMVPVAFAEDETVATPAANVAETYPIRLKDLNHTDPLTAEGLDLLMVRTGSSGTRYYNYALGESKIAACYDNGTLNWKFVATSNELIYRNDRMYQARLTKGWAAIQIRVEDSGLYALNLTTDKTVDEETETTAWTNTSYDDAGNIVSRGHLWSGDVTAYIIPVAVANDAIANAVIPEVAEGETAPSAAQVAIPTLLTGEYSVGTVAIAADQTDATFPKTRMEAGEYVVVYSTTGNNYCLSEMSLIGEAYELEEVASYALRPYDMSNTDPATYAGTANAPLVTDNGDGTYTYVEYVAFSKVVSTDLGWKYKAVSDSNTRARLSYAYQPVAKTAGAYVAVTIDVPESGEMYLSLVTDKTVYASTWGNSASAWSGDVTAYLLPASEYVDIATAVADADNCVGTRTLFADATTVTFEKEYLEAGQYVMIYSGSKAYYPVCEATLSKVAGQELPESDKLSGTVATYDFEIYNNERYAPIFTYEDGTTGSRGWGNGAFSGLEGVYEANDKVDSIIAKDYAAGIINYKLETTGNINSSVFEGNLADTDFGLRIQKAATTEAESRYMALRLSVPATAMYSVVLNASYFSVGTLNIYVYDADAEGTVAENMTEDNLAASLTGKARSFASAITAGDNIIVFEIDETTQKETLRLTSIDLIVNTETVTYDFALPQNEAFMNAWYAANGGTETAIPDGTNLYKWEGTSATFYPYAAIADAYASGGINWALGASSGAELSSYAATDSKNFRAETTRLRCLLENADSTLNYTSFHLNVANPGTYDVTVNYSKQSDSVKAYLFKAPNAYDEYPDRLYLGADGKGNERNESRYLTTYLTEENLVHGTSNYKAPEVNFTYTFEEAGEYVIAFTPVRTDKPNSMYISSIVMEPVSFNYIADGVGYATFDEAVANATESVVLLQNTQVGELVVPAGVTLDLNGYILYASSVDATAPGAQIIDALDGKGMIRGNIEFAEDNAQLPLYDIDADGYKLFDVEVESCATTGTGSNTKYWFKVNFANDAAFDLIGANTELRIMADMTGVIKSDSGNYVAGDEWAAVATADAAFTNAWADNNTSYIVVSAVGSNLSSFRLNPAVIANGVIISGSTMYKGSAS